MYNVYKVTAASIKKTPKGHELYNLQLNKSFWATKLVPLREADKIFDSLYKLYKKNNNLDFLTGRYIAADLKDSRFGKNLGTIVSFDVLQDFKGLLDKSNGKAFSTEMNVFGFLGSAGYPTNPDGTITLKAPYSNFNILNNGFHTICYPKQPEEGTLTLGNIGLIYEKFFKGKYIDNGNPDRDEQYEITSVAIVINRRIFHKSRSEVVSNDVFDVLRVGERLSEEQCRFLSEIQPSENQLAINNNSEKNGRA